MYSHIIVPQEIQVVDYSDTTFKHAADDISIQPGTYETEQITNPFYNDGCPEHNPWIIKGTTKGQIEEAWIQAGATFLPLQAIAKAA